MRLTDLLIFPIVALWQQKGRTLLTTLGVVFGAFVLAASLSINHGVQQTIIRESKQNDALRRVNVHPRWDGGQKSEDGPEIVIEGNMSEEKRQRIRTALVKQQKQTSPPETNLRLTPETLRQLASIEHVQRIEPHVQFQDFAVINEKKFQTNIESAPPQDSAHVRRIVAGRFFETADEPSAVVSEFLLYRSEIIDDEAVAAAVGKKMTIEIHSGQRSENEALRLYHYRPNGREETPAEVEIVSRLNEQLPQMVKHLDLTASDRAMLDHFFETHAQTTESQTVISREFTIVGVIRQVSEEEESNRRWWDYLGGNADIFLPCQSAADLFFESPAHRQYGLSQTLLVADNEEHVKGIARQVKDIGFQSYAPVEFIEREQFTWRLVFGGMTCVATVALLVAAMGITNTMLMNVLERTREIGIMKSVGAAGIHIQAIFLIEGILIGASGGVIGLLLALAASYPGDAWLRSMVERDMNMKLKDALFVFPPWLIATVILFAVLVTTAAAFYPARRAALVDPVSALRHE